MEVWANSIPKALINNEEIKGWVDELFTHKRELENEDLEQEFKDFEQLYANKFCKKCMPELDQILYEAIFTIFPDLGCFCQQIEDELYMMDDEISDKHECCSE